MVYTCHLQGEYEWLGALEALHKLIKEVPAAVARQGTLPCSQNSGIDPCFVI
jgi:hypothetical protein